MAIGISRPACSRSLSDMRPAQAGRWLSTTAHEERNRRWSMSIHSPSTSTHVHINRWSLLIVARCQPREPSHGVGSTIPNHPDESTEICIGDIRRDSPACSHSAQSPFACQSDTHIADSLATLAPTPAQHAHPSSPFPPHRLVQLHPCEATSQLSLVHHLGSLESKSACPMLCDP